MARFQKTVNLWDADTQEQIRKGALVLQTGQWVSCGGGPKSRWVGVTTGGCLWVAHSEGARGTKDSFKRMLACKPQRNASTLPHVH